MAVYKTIYCSPFSENADLASPFKYYTTDGGLHDGEPFYLTCRVDTSNKNVIGYSIKIYDDSGKTIFPINSFAHRFSQRVSPIDELPAFDDPTINTGVNGTFLKIPFFRNYHDFDTDPRRYSKGSFNCLYCDSDPRCFKADLIIGSQIPLGKSGDFQDLAKWDNMSNWNAENWFQHIDSLDPKPIDGVSWDGFLNGVKVTKESIIVVRVQYMAAGNKRWQLFKLNDTGTGLTALPSLTQWGDSDHDCFVTKGEYVGLYDIHKTTSGDLGPGIGIPSGIWFPAERAEKITQLLMDGSSYSWEITLYQGPELDSIPGFVDTYAPSPSTTVFTLINYLKIDKIPSIWFDMSFGQGTILGSNGTRLQLTDITKKLLPGAGVDNFEGLLNKYPKFVSILNYHNLNLSNFSPNRYGYQTGVFPCDYTMSYYGIKCGLSPLTMPYVREYDASLGHAYLNRDASLMDEQLSSCPKKWITEPQRPANFDDYLKGVSFYSHSLNPDEVYLRDTVDFSRSTNVNLNSAYGSTEDGTIILLYGQDVSSQNGVYVYHTSSPYFTRSAAFNSWGSFIGKIILDRASGVNFANSAEPGGTLDSSPLYFFEESPIQLFGLDNFINCGSIKFAHLPEGHLDINDLYYFYGKQALDISSSQLSDGLYFAYSYRSGQGQWYPYLFVGCIAMCVKNGIWRDIETEFPNIYTESMKYYCTPDNVYYFNPYGKKVLALPLESYVDNAILLIENDDQMLKFLAENVILPFMGDKVAFLLKNVPDSLFVSPNTSLDKNNRLEILGGHKIHGSTGQESGIISIEGVDKTLWSVSLASGAVSDEYATASFNADFYVYKYVPKSYNDGNGSPYKYSIISCFMTGSENPFTDYAPPSLSIAGAMGADGAFSASSTFVAGGEYHQGQGASWESYRFTLKNADGELLQDTGDRYDRYMETAFFGLESGGEYGKTYIVTLTVTDSIGYRSTFSAPLRTPKDANLTHYYWYPDVTPPTGRPLLEATADCFTHSVLIQYHAEAFPSYENGTASLYRREAGVFHRPGSQDKTYVGEWEPVAINAARQDFPIRDLNVASGHSYQYALLPKALDHRKLLANVVYDSGGSDGADEVVGVVRVSWDEWSISELIPEDPKVVVNGRPVEVPAIKRKYRVGRNGTWFLRLGAEMGSQEQNITRGDSQTLGRYDRVGYSPRHFDSGSASCYLGSEIVPCTPGGYVERQEMARSKPTSTNESAKTIALWKAFAQSRNPKLLKDRKGRKWIVQITSSSVTPQEPFVGIPAQISFSWKEIEPCDGTVLITGPNYMDGVERDRYPAWRPGRSGGSGNA